MLARFHAEAILQDWLPGGLVHDSFKVLASIEPRDIHQLRAIQREEPEAESAAQAEAEAAAAPQSGEDGGE